MKRGCNNMFKYQQYYEISTDDIATALSNELKNHGVTISPEEYKEIEESIFHLKCCAYNEYNPDYFRTLYNVLRAFTDNRG